MKFREKQILSQIVRLRIFIFVLAFLISFKSPFFIETLLQINSTTTAVQSISTIRTLQGQYASKHQGKFAPNFDELIKSVQLDDKFKSESPVVSGYIYKLTVQQPSETQPIFYSVTADPLNDESSYFSEHRHYYYDSTLRAIKMTDESRQATGDDPSL